MHGSHLALTHFVDVYDRHDLFEILDNERVLELSRLGGDGFSGVATLRRSTGIEQRRILCPGVAPVNVAVEVAAELQRTVGFSWQDCPAVLLSHSHVDPDRSAQLARDFAEAMDLPASRVHGFNLGCAGFLRLICEGAQIARDAGPLRHVPLISVEVPEQWHDAADKAFCGIVSAGATATTVWQGPGHRLIDFSAAPVFVPPENRYGGRPLFEKVFCEGFDFRGCAQTREVMHMDGESVFINGVELMLEAAAQALSAADVADDERVLAVPHQPSGKLLKTLIATAKIDLPQVQFLNNLPDYGNTLSSSIPTVLSRMEHVAACNEVDGPAPGDKVLLAAAGICMAKHRDHMTQGFATLEW